jgi:hypothetical protein
LLIYGVGNEMKKPLTQSIILILCLLIIPWQLIAQQTGHITYALNRVANPTADQQDAYAKITAAMDEAVTYYNTYTSITKNLSVNYAPDVSTADASFNGTIRFGKSRTYMVVLTALHEMAHTVGIGTTNEYRNLIVNGVFTGAKATAMLKEVTGDPTAVLKGDSQHFWPYGLNYASEFNSTDDYIFHCKIVDAMYQDMFQETLYATCYLRSVSDGRFMTVTAENKLILGERADSMSLVRLVALSGINTFRIEFNGGVLDIPNESVQPGVAAGVWAWNGGGHQQAVFEFDPNTAGANIARIKMKHSGLYLRTEGNQDNAGAVPASQQWELSDGEKTVAARNTRAVPPIRKLLHRHSDNSFLLDAAAGTAATLSLRVTDVRGREVARECVRGAMVMRMSGFAPGLYMVSVRGPGVDACERFVVR